MAATDRPEGTTHPVVAACLDADFVRLVSTADGDALAATGLLSRALGDIDVPYQASCTDHPDASGTDADCTLAIGWNGGDEAIDSVPLARTAYRIAREIAPDSVDSVLAIAGVVAAGDEPDGELLEHADLDRRAGVALPTDDVAEGLATTTLVRADFSGDETAIREGLGRLDPPLVDENPADDGEQSEYDADSAEFDRRLASWVALSIPESAPPRGAEVLEGALRPHVSDRFETIGGFAEVLDALARDRPGTGIALTLGQDVEDAALDVWKRHGRRAHEGLDAAETRRHDGLFVASVPDDAPIGTVARLCFGYRAPEPIALVVRDGAAAVAADRPIERPMREAAATLEGRATVRRRRGRARFAGTGDEFVAALREAL